MTAANAFWQSATESASPFSRSAFVILSAAQAPALPVSTRPGAGVTPASAAHAPLLSSMMCANRRAKDRTSGVGCKVYISAGTIAADLVMLVATAV